MTKVGLAIGAVWALLGPVAVSAQTIVQSGAVVPFHAGTFYSNGVLGDGGGTANPAISALGVFNGANCPFGVSSQTSPGTATTPAGLFTICQTATATTLTVQGVNGQATPSFNINVGGQVFTFPGPGTGNVTGPSSSIAGDLSCWVNTSGTVLSDCGKPITTPTTTVTGDQTCWGNTTGHALLDCGPVSPVYKMMAGANGFVCDGVTNDIAAFNTLLSTIYTANGGTIQVGGACFLAGKQIVPNSNPGSGYPTQPNIRITSVGSGYYDGSWTHPPSSTAPGTLIFGTGSAGSGAAAKIDTRGLGTLEIDHLTLISKDTSGGVPFIQTTNTTVKIHDDSFYGANTGTTSNEDGVVLGGCTACSATPLNPSATAAFQGYGSFVNNNYFGAGVRHGVDVNTFANAVHVEYNTVGTQAGSSTSADAPFILTGGTVSGSGQQFVTGVVISGNLVESVNYGYAVKAFACGQCEIVFNNSYDNGSAAGGVFLDSVTEQTLVIGGTAPGGAAQYLNDQGVSNTYISIDGNDEPSKFPGVAAGTPAIPNSFGTTNFVGSSNATTIQPVIAQSCGNQPLVFERSAAEGTNPGQESYGIDYCGGVQTNGNDAGNITNSFATGASFSANGRTWAANGTGGAMKINTGSGGSILTVEGFETLFEDQTGATQGRFYSSAGGSAGIGWDLGASFDTSLYRVSAGLWGTNSSFRFDTVGMGLINKAGTNGRAGTFICNGVTPVTVANTSVAITDVIAISLNAVGGTVGALPTLKTITAATGFTVACSVSDTSTYNYAAMGTH